MEILIKVGVTLSSDQEEGRLEIFIFYKSCSFKARQKPALNKTVQTFLKPIVSVRL